MTPLMEAVLNGHTSRVVRLLAEPVTKPALGPAARDDDGIMLAIAAALEAAAAAAPPAA